MVYRPITTEDVLADLRRLAKEFPPPAAWLIRPRFEVRSEPPVLKIGKLPLIRVELTPSQRGQPVRSVWDAVTMKLVICPVESRHEKLAAEHYEELHANLRRWLNEWRSLWRAFCWRSGWRPELQASEGMRVEKELFKKLTQLTLESSAWSYGGDAAVRSWDVGTRWHA